MAVEAAATAAALVRPAKLHVMTVAAAMDAGVVTVSTRLVVDMEATPTDRPVQVRAAVIVVPKFTPATVILAIRPTVAVVKVTVAMTPVAALTLLERTIEGETSKALNMAGKTTPVARSMFASAVAVVIVTVEAAAAAAALVRPAKLHVITVAAAMTVVPGVVTVITRLVVATEATPTVRPVQVMAAVTAVPVVRKFTPATVTALMMPAVAVVKVTVAVTPVAALRLLERTTEGATRPPKMAGATLYTIPMFLDVDNAMDDADPTARTEPRVNPERVTVSAATPLTTTAVVITIWVLVAVTAVAEPVMVVGGLAAPAANVAVPMK